MIIIETKINLSFYNEENYIEFLNLNEKQNPSLHDQILDSAFKKKETTKIITGELGKEVRKVKVYEIGLV